MDQPLCGVNVTGFQLQTWLSDYFRKRIKLASVSGAPIAAGQGFTSSLIRVRLEYDPSQADLEKLPKSLVIKSPNKAAIRELLKMSGGHSEENLEKFVQGLVSNHERELEAYRVLNIDQPIPIPRLYAGTPTDGETMGVIVMEDLGDRAEAICGQSTPLTIDQLEEVVKTMASLHAWCVTTEVNWKDRFEPYNAERRTQLYASFRPMLKEGYEKLQQQYPNMFNKLSYEKASYLAAIECMNATTEKFSDKFPEVMVHGDFYANNLMFERDHHQKTTSRLLGVVDWQLCHRGQGMHDLARLLVFNTSPEVRRSHTTRLLHLYYDTMTEKAGKAKLAKIEFEDVLALYEECFVSLAMFYTILIVWLQDLYVQDKSEKGDFERKCMLERCIAVYDDATKILGW